MQALLLLAAVLAQSPAVSAVSETGEKLDLVEIDGGYFARLPDGGYARATVVAEPDAGSPSRGATFTQTGLDDAGVVRAVSTTGEPVEIVEQDGGYFVRFPDGRLAKATVLDGGFSTEAEPDAAPAVEDENQYTPPPLETAQGYDMAGGQGSDRDAPKQIALTPGSKTPPKFVKGELSVFLGADRLVTKNNRIGVSIGVDKIGAPGDCSLSTCGDVYYALIEPQVDLRFLEDNKLALGIGVPLRLELFNFGRDASGNIIGTANAGKIRKEDYDQPSDFARVLKYLTYGNKEDRLYINAGQRYASSIGHGALVRRYAPNIDVDQVRVSAQVDAYNDYAGFELLTNDVVEWNLLSGLVFVKPASFFTDNEMAKSLSIGASVASDLKAPLSLTVDPATGQRQLDSTNHLKASTRALTLVGVDAELKVVKTQTTDIKPYVDYSKILNGDGGLTIGALGRFNVGTDIINAFRIVVEARSLGARYVPSYFDTFYEVERYIDQEIVPSPYPSARAYATKQEDVLSGRLGQRMGYYFEASYGIRRAVGVTVALEGTSNAPEKNLVTHLEVPALDWLQFFGSYYKRGFTDFSSITKVDNQSVFFAGARLRLLPILFINGRAFKTFRVNPEVQRYDNSFGFAVDVEIGYEFKREGKTEATPPPPEKTPASETKFEDKRNVETPAQDHTPPVETKVEEKTAPGEEAPRSP